ncbi:polymorphic toxin type 15 domain-containing protein [Shewanella colwelliana]|uniref:polymorphic toxin type 15 domain-containing protein n=1 Tax=Shewanella colwelliana TaxID=23 RepID=UPI0037369E28
MSSRIASLDSLMLHDAVLIESDLSYLSEYDWEAMTPSGFSLDSVKRRLQQGEYVVLSDAPRLPLFGIVDGKPTPNSEFGTSISVQTLALLTQRFGSAGSSVFYSADYKGNLHQSPPLDYIPDTSRVKEAKATPKPTLISDNFGKAPPKLELLLCYDDSEKTYASDVPYSVMFSDPDKTVIKGVLNDQGWAMVEGGPNYPAKVKFGEEAEKTAAESAIKIQYQQLDHALNDTAKQVANHMLIAKEKAKQTQLIEVTESFKLAVDNKIAALNAQSEAFDNLSYLAQTWEIAKATKEGASNGFTEYLPDLGDFGALMAAANIDITMLIEAISTGDIDTLEAKLQQWTARGGQGLTEARKTMETLILLLSDPTSREMLASVPKRIIAALPEDQVAELTAYQATQMGMDTAAIGAAGAVGSLVGGVGGPVAASVLFAATTARKGGKALEGTINIVADISKSLKKINNQHEAKPYKKENMLPLAKEGSGTTPNLTLREKDKHDNGHVHPALVRMNPYKAPCFEPSNQIKKNFKGDPKKLEGHYARQLKHQENGLNDLTIGEYQENRKRYKEMKREGTGKAQTDFRADFKDDLEASLKESYQQKMSPLEAEKLSVKRADEIMSNLAALHDPDMAAGGKDSVNRMGNASVNSSIGPQWTNKSKARQGKSRVQLMDEQVEAAAKRYGPDAKLNIQLERCSIRK